ncbi:hypothetical protein LC612_08165 [Nostoc sp. CHAB 5834]|nr:hypothetical protein [Nostoc sp. CHAB 5834]
MKAMPRLGYAYAPVYLIAVRQGLKYLKTTLEYLNTTLKYLNTTSEYLNTTLKYLNTTLKYLNTTSRYLFGNEGSNNAAKTKDEQVKSPRTFTKSGNWTP